MSKKNASSVTGQTALVCPAEKVESKEFFATVIVSLDKSAEAGQIVEIRAEPDNPADPKALAVYAEDEKIGYLANKPATVRPETKSAATLHKMVASKKTAKTYARLSDPEVITSNGAELASFKASLYFVPCREAAGKKKPPMVFRTFGAFISAPNRKALMDRLSKSEEESVKVLLSQASRGSQINVDMADPGDELSAKHVSVVACPESDDKEGTKNYAELSEVLQRGVDKIYGILEFVPAGTTPDNPDSDTLMLSVDIADANNMTKVNASIDKVIAQCIEQANTLDAKVKFMRSAGLTNPMICSVLDSYRLYPPEFEAMIPTPEYPFVDDSGEPVLFRSMAYHLHGKHIRLVGEKGCGKNTLIETVNWLLRRPLFRLSGNSDLDKTDILGSRTIENGNMKYELTTFLRVLEAGGDVDLDECNAIKPDVELIIHSLTDRTRAIQVPGYGEVKMDDRATFWMTMNEDYIGTSDMNDATVDRFVTIRIKSPSDIKEVLKTRVPNASEANINFCDKVYKDIQRSVQNGELSATCVSIRGFIDALECSDYVPITLSLLDTLAAKPQDISERKTLETILSNLGDP